MRIVKNYNDKQTTDTETPADQSKERKAGVSKVKSPSGVIPTDGTLHSNEADAHHQSDDGHCGDTRHIHAGGGKIILTSGRDGLIVGVHLICGGLISLLVSGLGLGLVFLSGDGSGRQ